MLFAASFQSWFVPDSQSGRILRFVLLPTTSGATHHSFSLSSFLFLKKLGLSATTISTGGTKGTGKESVNTTERTKKSLTGRTTDRLLTATACCSTTSECRSQADDALRCTAGAAADAVRVRACSESWLCRDKPPFPSFSPRPSSFPGCNTSCCDSGLLGLRVLLHFLCLSFSHPSYSTSSSSRRR